MTTLSDEIALLKAENRALREELTRLSNLSITPTRSSIDDLGYEQLTVAEEYKEFFLYCCQMLKRFPSWETSQSILTKLYQYLGCDVAFFYVSDHLNQECITLYSYPLLNKPELMNTRELYSDFPWVIPKILAGEIIKVPDISALPLVPKNELGPLLLVDMHSCMIVPIVFNQQVLGHFTVASSQSGREWKNAEAELIQNVGVILLDVYKRVAEQEAYLKYSNQLLDEILTVNNTGYFVWEYGKGVVTHYPLGKNSFLENMSIQEVRSTATSEQLKVLDEHIEKCIKTGMPFLTEIKFFENSKKETFVRVRGLVVAKTIKGYTSRMIVTSEDITEDVIQQNRLENAMKKAEEANAAKSEFLARMSHEIRTPMNAILGMAYLMDSPNLNSKQHQYLSSITTAANDLLRVINDILDFSKIDAQKLDIDPHDFNLDDVLEQLAMIFNHSLTDKPLEIIYDIEPTLNRYLHGDAERLKQVLINLLSNAVKFTESGNIILRVYEKEKNSDSTVIHFSVVDDGIGIEPEKLSQLFTAFTQVDGTVSRKYGGTGLGLAISRRLIELMGGSIQVSSEVGIGSTFHFSLPFMFSHECHKDNQLNYTDMGLLNVLVVDDNQEARVTLQKSLLSFGLHVDVAAGGYQAVTMINQHQSDSGGYDFVFMDYSMPDIDGLATAKIIHKNLQLAKKPTILLVSAFDDLALEGEDKEVISYYLHKPVSQSRLFDTLARCVGKSIHQVKNHSLTTTATYAALNECKVLLVEDNLVNQKVAEGMLKKQGVDVHIVNNGVECLELLGRSERARFDCILMDVEMPQMDGITAVQHIRKNNVWCNIPVIAMTAHALKGDRERLLNTGMSGYISKPIKPENLYQSIAHVLSQTTE